MAPYTMRHTKHISIKLLIFILVAWGIAVAAAFFFIMNMNNSTKKEEKSDAEEMPQNVDQKILSFDLSNYKEDGSKKWLLRGDTADIFAEVVNLVNINMETYDEPKITLTAARGDYNTATKEITLFDDVRVKTSDGARIFTNYLKWDSKTDTVTTDKPIRITRSDMVADGIGALAIPQKNRVILDKDIKVELKAGSVKDMPLSYNTTSEAAARNGRAPKVKITCDGPLEINYDQNKAIFRNNVVVDDKKGQIYADRMDAFLDPQNKNIVKVVAEGDVRVVHGDDSTHSEKAIYTTKDQRVVLIGKPKIYIHSSEEIDNIEKSMEGL